MKKWIIEISQNGWECTGWAKITAEHVEQIDDNVILADDMRIEFDEEVGAVMEE